MLVDYDTYQSQNFTCSKCGWQGRGSELGHGDFSELHVIGNLDCPKCFELIAFWQGRLLDKEDEEE